MTAADAARVTRLGNGVRVASRRLPGRAGAAAAIVWHAGARAERAGEAGCAHLAEHLLFPDDARDLAAIDAMGGQVNAWSARDHCVFHAYVPVARLGEALGLLAARLAHGSRVVDPIAFEREREVIRRERFAEADDTLERALHHCLDHAGPAPADGAIDATSAGLRRFIERELHGGALSVGVAGDLPHDDAVTACAELACLPAAAVAEPAPRAPVWRDGVHEALQDSGPPGLLWLMPTAPAGTPEAAALAVAERALCGGLAAPLFTALRARRLAYGVHSAIETWRDGGFWALQVVCLPSMQPAVNDLVERALATASGPAPVALDIARAGLAGDAHLADDDPAALAERLARFGAHGHARPPTDAEAVRAALHTAWRRCARFVTGATATTSVPARR